LEDFGFRASDFLPPSRVLIPTEKGSGFIGEHRVILPSRTAEGLRCQKPLLGGLIATGAGYFPKATGHLKRRPAGIGEMILIYCVKGGGWCEVKRQLYTLREGDLLVLPPGMAHAYGAHGSNPWTIHWLHASGTQIPDYLRELGISEKRPVVRMGNDLQLALLFNEVLHSLERGSDYHSVLRASHTLAHLLSIMIERGQDYHPDTADGLQKVAQIIIYMSEHMDQSLKVSSLAALCNLSVPHFTVLFKQQTGCSPRDYLHLLRIHRACQLLQDEQLNVKDIAARLGYQDQFHFSRRFKAFQGISPSQYRKQHPVGSK
jgi:AraC-like DNA-binding protein